MKHLGVPFIVSCVVFASAAMGQSSSQPASGPAPLRIESVVPAASQPAEKDPAVIWCDDFDGPVKTYTESAGELDSPGLGGAGKCMLCLYEKGSQGKGNRKVFFGDAPAGKPVAKGRSFDEIYWRIYVKHQPGWIGGGPDKMSRATSIVSDNWQQAMISHVWSSGDGLTLDPASGVRDGQVVTTKYNDFDNLHWLGNKPVSAFKISSTAEAGWWVCVESRAKLNTPGKADGVNQLWIDGRLACERKNLDWRGTYAAHSLNAVFLEAYWNKGSPVTQKRWYDNFVISTKPIGPIVAPPNPTLIRTAPADGAKPAAWQVEITADDDEKAAVWKGEAAAGKDRITADAKSGKFIGDLEGKTELPPGTYLCRLREQDQSGKLQTWSPWHQAFGVR